MRMAYCPPSGARAMRAVAAGARPRGDPASPVGEWGWFGARPGADGGEPGSRGRRHAMTGSRQERREARRKRLEASGRVPSAAATTCSGELDRDLPPFRPKAAPGLESEYKPRLPAGRLPGASCSLLIKRSGVRIPLRAPSPPSAEYETGRRTPSGVHRRPWTSAPTDVKTNVRPQPACL